MPQTPEIDLRSARITSRQLPIFPRNAHAVCLEIKLPAAEARRLFEAGMLSFDPDADEPLDESREAELVFLGSLVASGCGRKMVDSLLGGLEPPYNYDLGRLFYDFRARVWRLVPGLSDPEAAFFQLLEDLDGRQARKALDSIRTWLDEALDVARERSEFFYQPHPLQKPGMNADNGSGDIAQA